MKRKYNTHKHNAEKVGKVFNLSYTEWCEIWNASGHWGKWGNKKGQYCMSRFGDIGPYEVGNVFIQLHSENVAQANAARVWTQESIEKRRKTITGTKYKPRV